MHSQAIDCAPRPRRPVEERRVAFVMKLAFVVWSFTMLLNGTYVRTRSSASFEAIDWLVIARLMVAGAGVVLGSYLISKRRFRLGTGSKIVIAYVLTALVSTLFSDYIRQSVGYWALLVGAGLLTVGLVSQQTSASGLSRIETLYFVVLAFCVLKDATLSVCAPELREAMIVQSVPPRLGTGLVPPNRLSIMAALAFWTSFKFNGGRAALLLWLLRLLMVAVVITTRSRVPLIALVAAGMVWFWIEHRTANIKEVAARCGLLFLVSSILLALALLIACEFGPLMSILGIVNRGEDVTTTMSLTGRTDIWALVLSEIASHPVTAVVGHGYGASIILLRDIATRSLHFIPRHTHNTFFEFLLTMGVPGLVLCCTIFLYGFRWFRVLHANSAEDTIYRLARNGVSVFTMILLISMTEVYIAEKINFVLMAMLMYLAILGHVEMLKRNEAAGNTPG